MKTKLTRSFIGGLTFVLIIVCGVLFYINIYSISTSSHHTFYLNIDKVDKVSNIPILRNLDRKEISISFCETVNSVNVNLNEGSVDYTFSTIKTDKIKIQAIPKRLGDLVLDITIKDNYNTPCFDIRYTHQDEVLQEIYYRPYKKLSRVDVVGEITFDINSIPYKNNSHPKGLDIKKYYIDLESFDFQIIDTVILKNNLNAANLLLLGQKAGVQFIRTYSNNENDLVIKYDPNCTLPCPRFNFNSCDLFINYHNSTRVLAHELLHAYGLKDIQDRSYCSRWDKNIMIHDSRICNNLGPLLTYGQILEIHGMKLLHRAFSRNTSCNDKNLEYQYIPNLDVAVVQNYRLGPIITSVLDLFEHEINKKDGLKWLMNNGVVTKERTTDTNKLYSLIFRQIKLIRKYLELEYRIIKFAKCNLKNELSIEWDINKYINHNLSAIYDNRIKNTLLILDMNEINYDQDIFIKNGKKLLNTIISDN